MTPINIINLYRQIDKELDNQFLERAREILDEHVLLCLHIYRSGKSTVSIYTSRKDNEDAHETAMIGRTELNFNIDVSLISNDTSKQLSELLDDIDNFYIAYDLSEPQ